MDIKQFIVENDVIKSKNLIDRDLLQYVEHLVGIPFGKELTAYIMTYGYLIFEDVELYGINERQGLDSDMVKQTQYLHQYFEVTLPYVALENRGDGDYFLIDSKDQVYEFIAEQNKLVKTEFTLFDYIVHRFENARTDR